ncbi:MAG: hypothetical protein B6243_06020 [Anaerolineaceae bacterium 4572_5.2]|nr:MAG: hypothetical protein B6243_06020 [Anaerolineaceae bacterium 4572_5.2]
MNSHKPLYEEDLDGQFFSLRSSLIVQVAILLLFLTLGGVDRLLEQKLPLATRNMDSVSQNNAPSPRTVVWVNKELTDVKDVELPYPTEMATLPVDDHDDAHLQDIQFKRQRLSQNNRHYEPPLSIPPIDVAPHIDSPEGRALMLRSNMQGILSFFMGGQFDPGIIQ